MARARKEVNIGLPSRWRFTRNAYYYQVPIGLEKWWNFKQTYRLGTTFEEALAEFERVSNSKEMFEDIPTNKLLNLPTIITSAKEKILYGVYFLLLNQEIVYVGRSNAILERISAHIGNKLIDFDSYHIIPCEGIEQERLEQVYIAKFKPKHNIRCLVGLP